MCERRFKVSVRRLMCQSLTVNVKRGRETHTSISVKRRGPRIGMHSKDIKRRGSAKQTPCVERDCRRPTATIPPFGLRREEVHGSIGHLHAKCPSVWKGGRPDVLASGSRLQMAAPTVKGCCSDHWMTFKMHLSRGPRLLAESFAVPSPGV